MKRVFLIVAMVVCLGELQACDICGCGVGGGYLGILPEFQKNIIGLRYRYNSLLTHLGAGGSTTYLTSTEKYQTVELWAGLTVGKKLRLMPVLPYAFNTRNNQGTSRSKNGIGDASVVAYYRLLDKTQATGSQKLLVQSLWIGGGFKLPTGKYVPEDKQSTSQNANLFQLGTASVDFTVNGMYDLRLQDAGINVSGSYKMNTENKYNYRYGNRLNGSAQVYYKLRVKNLVTIAPNAGIGFENSKKDTDDSFSVDISGGNMLMGTVGTEAVFKNLSAGANWQTPLSQSLANGAVKANNRVMIHAAVLF